MFYTAISKETVDEIFTIFFRNLGLVESQADLILRSLEFDGDTVVIEADLDQETLQ